VGDGRTGMSPPKACLTQPRGRAMPVVAWQPVYNTLRGLCDAGLNAGSHGLTGPKAFSIPNTHEFTPISSGGRRRVVRCASDQLVSRSLLTPPKGRDRIGRCGDSACAARFSRDGYRARAFSPLHRLETTWSRFIRPIRSSSAVNAFQTAQSLCPFEG